MGEKSEDTTICISRFVKEKLDKIKDRNGHKTMDSVVRYLLTLEEGKGE